MDGGRYKEDALDCVGGERKAGGGVESGFHCCLKLTKVQRQQKIYSLFHTRHLRVLFEGARFRIIFLINEGRIWTQGSRRRKTDMWKACGARLVGWGKQMPVPVSWQSV